MIGKRRDVSDLMLRMKVTKDDLYFDDDRPEVEIGDDLASKQRVLPDNKRPSVVAGPQVCVRPDLWIVSNRHVFGCARCSEQDVCRMYRDRYSQEAVHKGDPCNQPADTSFTEAAKYWKVKPRCRTRKRDDPVSPIAAPGKSRRKKARKKSVKAIAKSIANQIRKNKRGKS